GLAPRARAQSIDGLGSGLSTGAIIGVSIGSLVGGALLAILFLLFLKQRKSSKAGSPTKERPKKSKYKVEPWAASPNPASNRPNRPNVASVSSTTPWIIEQGPIGGDAGAGAPLLGNLSPDASPSALSSASHRKGLEASLEGTLLNP